MSVAVGTLIANLPAYRDEWILIHPKQTVKDIIREVLEAHDEFAPYYDQIALYFDADTTEEICERLVEFCKSNIKYKEESEDDQTSALPTGILTRGFGDCKHYAGFIGGILDALNRRGRKINWCYVFASYRILDKTPHHVFIEVTDKGKQLWLDVTPGADKIEPHWVVRKKIKAMALHRNIAGLQPDLPTLRTIGGNQSVHPKINGDNNINWDGTNRYGGIWNPYLGLSMYKDLGGYTVANKDQAAAEINAEIAKGPDPGHQVTPDFVQWIYDNNIRSWNFYWQGGVQPDFTAADLLRPDMPRLVYTEDHRLTFDRDVKVDDYRNDQIHLLTAWAQALINEFDTTPYPVTPKHLKEFSQNYTGMPGNPQSNLFTEARGAGFFKQVTHFLGDSLKAAAKGWIKIVGSIPRNAFLALVGLNVFGFATKMASHIDGGDWDKMAAKWKKMGGNPEKLRGTIDHGKSKNAILGGTDGDSMGVVAESTAALIAAAAPIIAAMLAFLPKDQADKVKEVLSATKTYLGTKYPDLDLDAYGFVDKTTGKEVEYEIDPADDENLGGGDNKLPATGYGAGDAGGAFIKNLWDKARANPLPAAAAVGLGVYLLTNKGKMSGSKSKLLLPLAAAAGTYFYLSQQQPTYPLPPVKQ